MPVDPATLEPSLYRDLMRFRPDDLTPNGWAVRAGVSRTVWADMRRHGNPSRKTLERLLVAAGSSLAEFEALRIEDSPRPGDAGRSGSVGDVGRAKWRGPSPSTLPLLATEIDGEWPGSIIGIEQIVVDRARHVGQVARPDSLAADRDAYAIIVVGDAMWPRFRLGRPLLVSPLALVAVGDDVLVELRSASGDMAKHPARALVKELLRRTASFVELRQFNPMVEFRVEASAIAALHRVIGESY